MSKRKVKQKRIEEKTESFSFRIKLGEYEIEINGPYEKVTKTIENLPNIVTNVQKAMETVKPKTVATLTVKTEPTDKSQPIRKPSAQKYPRIASSANCEESVIRLLETYWGKWRPRTMEELGDAMKANKIKYSKRTINGTLNKLADKGKVKRWNTNTGFVYILAEGKSLGSGEDEA